MKTHQVLHMEIFPPARGQLTLLTIATPRGIFTGCADYAPRHAVADLVDIWHPVPRWMRPWQVIEPFLE